MNDETGEIEEVITCPLCGNEIAYLEKVCHSCNTELNWGSDDDLIVNDCDYVECRNCHKEVPKNAKFCSECGSNMCYDGFEDYESSRILPKCPNCGEELDYGASHCDACNTDIEWKSTDNLLISLDSFKIQERTKAKVLPRYNVEYREPKLSYNTFTSKLKENARRVTIPKRYSLPQLQFNSFGMYSNR